MKTVHETYVQIARPSGYDTVGAIEPGNYTVEGDTVTLTDVEGVPIASGRMAIGYSAKMAEGEHHADVARRLIWRHYRATKGGSDFNRKLTYETKGWR